MKYLLTALALACATPAHAGDPCPIGVMIVDLGVPEWLDRTEVLAGLSSTRARIGIVYDYGTDGVTITAVLPQSPADAAGLRRGDIIHTIGGTPVGPTGTVHTVADAATPGDTVDLDVSRDGRNLTLTLTFGATDPVPAALADAGSRDDCRFSETRTASEAERATITPQLTDENRAFRCNDAHIDLRGPQTGDTVYFLRGSRRVLVTFPDWGTVCVPSQVLDGPGLAGSAADVLLPLIAPYAEDRMANP